MSYESKVRESVNAYYYDTIVTVYNDGSFNVELPVFGNPVTLTFASLDHFEYYVADDLSRYSN